MEQYSAWINSWQRSLLYQENGSTVEMLFDTTISDLLRYCALTHYILPVVVLINVLLIWGTDLASIRLLLISQIRSEILNKINIEKKFKYLNKYKKIKKTPAQDWKFKDVEFTDLSIKGLNVKGLKINGLKYTEMNDTLIIPRITILGGNYSSLYFDNFGFESLAFDELTFRSFSFDVIELNNELRNTKYHKARSNMTYMDYVSIIALGAFINSICGYSNSYGVYSNIKYGSVKRTSNPHFEELQNAYFKRQLIKHKLNQTSNTLFQQLPSVNSSSQIEEHRQLTSLLRNTLEIEISEMNKDLDSLNAEVPEDAWDISVIKKTINEKAQLIEKLDKENEVFFDIESPKKTPHSNKDVDTNSEKQEKLNTVPVERVQENLPTQTPELTKYQRYYVERLEHCNAERRSRGEQEYQNPWSINQLNPGEQFRNTQEFEKAENKKVHQEEKNKKIKQETEPSITNNGKKNKKKK